MVLYRTDGRGGITYDLPAVVTCTRESHPRNDDNPIPLPETPYHVHLTVFTPGEAQSYQEFDVPQSQNSPHNPEPRTWRWLG